MGGGSFNKWGKKKYKGRVLELQDYMYILGSFEKKLRYGNKKYNG